MDNFIGQILLVAFKYTPNGYLPCDGRTMNIRDNEALYTLIQNTYGGSLADGTFALPNMAGKSPDPSMHYIICSVGIYPPPPN
ncbi:phage tail protein [Azospirillum endophyticum]